MRCPACGEGNSDRAVFCELCQAPLRGQQAAESVKPETGPQPPVFYLPQPTARRDSRARGLLLVFAFVGLGGAAVTAYRYWPEPAAPQAASAPVAMAPVTPPSQAAPPSRPPSTELPAPPVPKPQRSAVESAPPPAEPIIEIKPSEPRGARSVSPSWFEGAEGFERAKKEQAYGNVPMIIYFRVDWCPYCRRMDQDIIGSSAVREFLANVVKVRINPESSPADDQLARGMGVKGFPSVYVVPHPGSSPEKIPSLSRKANEPIDLSVEKFISAAQQAGIRQAQKQMTNGFDKLRRGDTAGARADLDRAIEMNPRNAEAYFWRGDLDAKAGELGKAVGNFKRAIELEPERKDALLALAGIYGRNREYDEAIKYLSRAIRLDPGYARGIAFAQRGHSYKMKGDTEAANADFAEACRRGTTSACTMVQQ
jgi:Flp pilus assembly protein TadD